MTMRVSLSLRSPIRAIPSLATVLSPSEVAEPAIDPFDHFRQAGEYMDDAEDDDPMTGSDPETVEIVQDRVIYLDQAGGDQDESHPQLGHRVVYEAFQAQRDSHRRTRPPGGPIGTRLGQFRLAAVLARKIHGSPSSPQLADPAEMMHLDPSPPSSFPMSTTHARGPGSRRRPPRVPVNN
jgi:hypothetical protein